MPTLTTQSHLTANLSCLKQRNAVLAKNLATVAAHPGALFADTPNGAITATLNGAALCSRQSPLDEASRLVADIDLVNHAVVVVLGFGLGYHVRKLVERSEKATLVVVFEPDLSLLRAVFENVDHSSWLNNALVLFVADPSDRGALGKKLEGSESILAQGVHVLEHPASRARLRDESPRFISMFSEFVTAARTTLTTTLMRSVDTVRNLMLNLDHYAAGSGIKELENIASGFPAVVVSAGPSLHKNIHELAKPGVRERCLVIAVQTALKPLLAAGVTPHFVTALDYHEISRRFYEDLDASQLRDVTLIADPKANPVILDVYPGPLRCCANGYLDKLLGSTQRDMGTVPAGATVAHLAVYLARYVGCTHIALIGQDLGFTDGLYYAPGTAIHDVWAPELNPFNTIEMMEWQRIARHRTHLVKTRDIHGKSIYTDAQMHTYLQQFERDFAEFTREGRTIVDATEGGVAKQHTTVMPLAEFLHTHAVQPLPQIPLPAPDVDRKRLNATRQRLLNVRADVRELKRVSDHTAGLLRSMIDDQRDPSRMARHFEKIESNRRIVEQKFESFELLNFMNQLGVFRRIKADRRLHMQRNLDALARQRGQLERDLENVTWIADAAQELIEQIDESQSSLAGQRIELRPRPARGRLDSESVSTPELSKHVAALVPIDLERGGTGVPRRLSESFNGSSVLQATLVRLGQSDTLQSIILIAKHGDDVDSLIDRSSIRLPVEIERCDQSPFGPEREAMWAARLWSDTCWRGGIAGIGIYDEVLCPQVMHTIMHKRGLSAALIVGPDWPLVQVTGDQGCDALVRRHREHPEQHNLVFTQAPPGLCGCVISATLMGELSQRNRLSTIGGLLVYQPHAPQGDPIARDVCVQIDHRVRNAHARATFNTPRNRAAMIRALESNPRDTGDSVQSFAACGFAPDFQSLPQHVSLELCTDRTSCGILAKCFHNALNRTPITLDLAHRIIDQLAESSDSVLTLAGAGDPLLHPHFDTTIRHAKSKGIRGVHVRTELLCDQRNIDRLLASGVDVVSIELNADRAATYVAMMGVDRFKDVLMNIEYLLSHRRRLTSHAGTAAFAMPWVVPVIRRCSPTYEDIDTFFDRWQHTLGTAVIEGMPRNASLDSLAPAVTPRRVIERERRRCMTIRCDGIAQVDVDDWTANDVVGNVRDGNLFATWNQVLIRREAASGEGRSS